MFRDPENTLLISSPGISCGSIPLCSWLYWSAQQRFSVAQYQSPIFVHILISSPDISVAQYSCVKQYWSAHDKKYGSVFAHIDQLFRDYLRLNISLCFGNIDQLNRDSLWLNINAFIVSFQKIWATISVYPVFNPTEILWLKRYTALSFWSAWIEILSLQLSKPWPCIVHGYLR